MEVKVEHIFFQTNNHILLEDINYTFPSSSITSIIGPSGSGKSLLTKLMTALEKPTSGNIQIGAYSLSDKTTQKELKNFHFQVGYLFQNASVEFFEPTVYKELEFNLQKFQYRLSNKEKQMKDVLKIVGLNEKCLSLNPFELSYGEKTKLALALLLELNPKVLILDEPTIGLDNKNKKRLGKLLKKLAIRYHKTIIIVSNDIQFILETSQNLLVINQGKQIMHGSVKEVLKQYHVLKENNIEIPSIIEFIHLVYEKKQCKLEYTTQIKDLIKDIYRHVAK